MYFIADLVINRVSTISTIYTSRSFTSREAVNRHRPIICHDVYILLARWAVVQGGEAVRADLIGEGRRVASFGRAFGPVCVHVVLADDLFDRNRSSSGGTMTVRHDCLAPRTQTPHSRVPLALCTHLNSLH